MTEALLEAGVADRTAADAEPRRLNAALAVSDESLLRLARELRATTMQAIVSNGSARLVISDEFLNIDYLIDRENLFLGLHGEFQSLARVASPGHLFMAGNGRKYILINPFASIQDRQFFLAAQLAHFRLHVPEAIVREPASHAGVYFPKKLIDPACFRQASIFAYGLLVPQDLESILVANYSHDGSDVDLIQDVVNKTLMPANLLRRHISLVSKNSLYVDQGAH